MTIAIDVVSGVTGTAVSTLTIAHNCAAGAVLVAFAAELGDTPTVTGVTYNAVAMTQLMATTDDSGGLAKNSAWLLYNPASGSHNLVATFSSAGGGYAALHGLSYTGVVATSAAAAHRTAYHAGAASGGANVTVTDSVSGDMVVGSCANYNGGAGLISVGATWTTRRFDTAIDGGASALGSQDKIATGASTSVVFVNDDYCTNIGFALIPAAAGGRTTKNVHSTGLGMQQGIGLGMPAGGRYVY